MEQRGLLQFVEKAVVGAVFWLSDEFGKTNGVQCDGCCVFLWLRFEEARWPRSNQDGALVSQHIQDPEVFNIQELFVQGFLMK